jgi:hypothetical protein
MPLPEWAYPPEPGFEHGDNYSSLEIVWKHGDGRVIIQIPPVVVEPEVIEIEGVPADGGKPKRHRLFGRGARD